MVGDINLGAIVGCRRLDVNIVYRSLHPVAVGVYSECVERVIVLLLDIPRLVLAGVCSPLLSREAHALRVHQRAVAIEVDELVDRLRRTEHKVQRLERAARLYVELGLALRVESEILYAERCLALARIGCAHNAVSHIRSERVLAVSLNEVAHYDVMVLAGSDKLRCAALRLLAIDERNALTAHTGVAVAARHHERREHLLEFCFGHLRERRASEVLQEEELEIRLAYAHLIERLVVGLCGYGVLHVVLSSLEVAHLSLELLGHTLGTSERDVVVGAEHYSVNRSAAFIEKYLLLRVGCSNESYDERKY